MELTTTGLVGLRRSFTLSYYESHGSKSTNDLDILKLFVYTLRELKLPIVKPKSSSCSMKSYILAFSHILPCSKKG